MTINPNTSKIDKLIIDRMHSLPFPMCAGFKGDDIWKFHMKRKIKKFMLEVVGPNCEVANDEMKLYDEGANDTKENLREIINKL